jgi:hexokinase
MTTIPKREEILFSLDELKEVSQNFTTELKDSFRGEKTSLAFLKNTLPKTSLVEKGERFQVMAIGGSNFETGIMVRGDKGFELSEYYREPLMLLETKEILLELILRNLHSDIELLNINFAYPIEALSRDGLLEGRLVGISKEHKLEGLMHKQVGEEVEKEVLKKTGSKIRVSVANDTVCLLLAGLNMDKRENLVGGIVGTGMNFSIFIDETTVVNLESGNFDKFEMTQSGILVDEKSNDKGRQKFEKEISGGYLFRHYNALIKEHEIDTPEIKDTKDLDEIAADENHLCHSIASALMERSASLVAAHIAGIYFFKKTDRLTNIVEGSVYWRGLNYTKYVDEYLEKLGCPKSHISFEHIDRSSLYGAAGLAG